MVLPEKEENNENFAANGQLPEMNGANLAEFGDQHGPYGALRRKASVNGVLLDSSPLDFQLEKQIYPITDHPKKLIRSQSEVWEILDCSQHAKNTVNPIRKIVDFMNIKPNPEKQLLKLHLGDPTLTGYLPIAETVVQAVQKSLLSGKYNGYGPATGLPEVRNAVVKYYSTPTAPITPDDVIMTSGCSHALQLAIESLANPGDNILVPRPGFPLYSTLMRPHDIDDRHYNLQIDNNWEVDLRHLENLIDHRTKAMVINNPSNPCGAVYTKEHLTQILRVAERHKVPVIADEIYGDLVYDGAQFHPMAHLQPKVPILTCDGISKRYLAPGWRLGWLIVHDRFGALTEVRNGIRQLATKIVGPSVLIQGALPDILRNTPEEFFARTKSILGQNARAAMEELHGVPGLTPVKPQGAMYMMVGMDINAFSGFKTEMDFIKALIAEESVYCLPGRAFNFSGAFRLVLAYNEDLTREACRRIREFCARHYRDKNEGMVDFYAQANGHA